MAPMALISLNHGKGHSDGIHFFGGEQQIGSHADIPQVFQQKGIYPDDVACFIAVDQEAIHEIQQSGVQFRRSSPAIEEGDDGLRFGGLQQVYGRKQFQILSADPGDNAFSDFFPLQVLDQPLEELVFVIGGLDRTQVVPDDIEKHIVIEGEEETAPGLFISFHLILLFRIAGVRLIFPDIQQVGISLLGEEFLPVHSEFLFHSIPRYEAVEIRSCLFRPQNSSEALGFL
jgi:hypothetical protein